MDENGKSPALMPQNRINTLVKISLKTRGTFSFEELIFQHVYMTAQNRVAAYEMKSPDYNLLHASLKMKIGNQKPLMINIGVKNILNERYIDHLSRLKNIDMPHPGRNFYLSVNYIISKSLRSRI
jgi:iron complex outermembrane receptor protein